MVDVHWQKLRVIWHIQPQLINIHFSVGKAAVVTRFSGHTEENNEKLQSGQSVPRPEFEPATSRIFPVRVMSLGSVPFA